MPFKKGDKNINRKGRKPRSEELGICERLDSVKPIGEVLNKLNEAIKKGNVRAIEIWLHYYFGKPKETLKLDGDIKIQALKLIKASDSNANGI
jgi:hypothetical protein